MRLPTWALTAGALAVGLSALLLVYYFAYQALVTLVSLALLGMAIAVYGPDACPPVLDDVPHYIDPSVMGAWGSPLVSAA